MLLRIRTWLRSRISGANLHPALERQRRFDEGAVNAGRRVLPSWRQLRALPSLMSATERRAATALALLLVASLATLALRAWWRSGETVPVPGGAYVEGLVGTPQYINPILGVTNDVDRDLASLVFCSLVKLDSSGQLVPDLAESLDVSEDGLTYTARLRSNATWHDGTPVSVDDVAFTVSSLQDETFPVATAAVWADVDLTVVDDRTVSFHLPRAFPDFKQALTTGLLPAHLWRDIPVANVKLTTLNSRPVGCGSFAFAKLTRDSRGNVRTVTLQRHEGYHGQKPYLDELVFKFYPDYETAVAALLNGNIQGLGSLPASSVDAASERRSLSLHRLTVPQYTAVFFNLRGSALLQKAEVRRALALAADRGDVLAKALDGQGQVVDGPVLPPPVDAPVPNGSPDADGARAALADAGWKEQDGTWTKGNATATVRLLAADRPEHRAVAESLAASWQAAGIPTAVELVDRLTLRDRVRAGEFEAVVFSESLGATGSPFSFWHSSQAGVGGLNISGWSNRDADALLEQARAATDPAVRLATLAKFQDLVKQQQPALFLYSPTYVYPVNASIKGIRADRLGTPSDRFSGISDWYIRTKRVR